MKSDRRGDLGFGEAIVATVAVVLVFNAFAVVVAITHPQEVTVAEHGLSLHGSISDGVFFPSFLHEMEDAVLSDVTGVSVRVSFPGGFCADAEFTVGSMEGPLTTFRDCDVLDDDMGRTIPVVYEVTLCV